MAVAFEVEGKRQDTSTEAYLVDKILAMIVAQLLRAYDTMHVCLHQLLHNPNTQTHFVSKIDSQERSLPAREANRFTLRVCSPGRGRPRGTRRATAGAGYRGSR